jgi:hypothetical protein
MLDQILPPVSLISSPFEMQQGCSSLDLYFKDSCLKYYFPRARIGGKYEMGL